MDTAPMPQKKSIARELWEGFLSYNVWLRVVMCAVLIVGGPVGYQIGLWLSTGHNNVDGPAPVMQLPALPVTESPVTSTPATAPPRVIIRQQPPVVITVTVTPSPRAPQHEVTSVPEVTSVIEEPSEDLAPPVEDSVPEPVDSSSGSGSTNTSSTPSIPPLVNLPPITIP